MIFNSRHTIIIKTTNIRQSQKKIKQTPIFNSRQTIIIKTTNIRQFQKKIKQTPMNNCLKV